MKVVLNGLVTLWSKTGVGQYTASLYRHLLAQRGPDEIAFYPGGLRRRVLGAGCSWLLKKRPRDERIPTTDAGSFLRRNLGGVGRGVRHLAARMLAADFRWQISRGRCDLYHEPNYMAMPTERPTVVTVHDLSVLLHPEWHPAERVRAYETRFRASLQGDLRFIADTEYIRREMIDLLGVHPSRITAIHLGVRPELRPLPPEQVESSLDSLGLEPGYLLHIGAIEPRKNLLMLMKAFVDLPPVLRERHPLVLVGGWGWRNEAIQDYYHSTARHAGVFQLGYVPDEHLSAVYNGARALVFPSHYEGFGFPPLEMLACGGAVLASDIGSLREILPASQRLMPADDQAAWREAMYRLLTDDDYWNEARRGGPAHARQFNWDDCARQTWSAYENILGCSRLNVPLAA